MQAATEHIEHWEPAMALTRRPRQAHSRPERYRLARALRVGRLTYAAQARGRA